MRSTEKQQITVIAFFHNQVERGLNFRIENMTVENQCINKIICRLLNLVGQQ